MTSHVNVSPRHNHSPSPSHSHSSNVGVGVHHRVRAGVLVGMVFFIVLLFGVCNLLLFGSLTPFLSISPSSFSSSSSASSSSPALYWTQNNSPPPSHPITTITIDEYYSNPDMAAAWIDQLVENIIQEFQTTINTCTCTCNHSNSNTNTKTHNCNWAEKTQTQTGTGTGTGAEFGGIHTANIWEHQYITQTPIIVALQQQVETELYQRLFSCSTSPSSSPSQSHSASSLAPPRHSLEWNPVTQLHIDKLLSTIKPNNPVTDITGIHTQHICHTGVGVHSSLVWHARSDFRAALMPDIPLNQGLQQVPIQQLATGTLSPDVDQVFGLLEFGSVESATAANINMDSETIKGAQWENVCISWRQGQPTLELDRKRFKTQQKQDVPIPVRHMYVVRSDSESPSSSSSSSSLPLIHGTTFWWPLVSELLTPNSTLEKSTDTDTRSPNIPTSPIHDAYHALYDDIISTIQLLHQITSPSRSPHVSIDYWLLGTGVPFDSPPFDIESMSPEKRSLWEWYQLLQRAWLGPKEVHDNGKFITIPNNWVKRDRERKRQKEKERDTQQIKNNQTQQHRDKKDTEKDTNTDTDTDTDADTTDTDLHPPTMCFEKLIIPYVQRTAYWPFNMLNKSDTSLIQRDPTSSIHSHAFSTAHVTRLRNNMASLLNLPPNAASVASASSSASGSDPLRVLIYGGTATSHHRWLNGDDVTRWIAPQHYVTYIKASHTISAQSSVRLAWQSDVLFTAHSYPFLLSTIFLPHNAIVLQTQGYMQRQGLGGFLDVLSSSSVLSLRAWSLLCGVWRKENVEWQARDTEDYICVHDNIKPLLQNQYTLDLEQL